jgi:hypothetical protein
MSCSTGNQWSIRTFAHDRNRLIQWGRESCIQRRIVAGSYIDLLRAQEREHLSNEIGSIRFRGDGEGPALESIRDRQEYVLGPIIEPHDEQTEWHASELTPLTTCRSIVTVGLSTMKVPSTTGTKTKVP